MRMNILRRKKNPSKYVFFDQKCICFIGAKENERKKKILKENHKKYLIGFIGLRFG